MVARRLSLLVGTVLASGVLWPLAAVPEAAAPECPLTREEFVRAVSVAGHGSPSTAQYEAMCANLSDGHITTKDTLVVFLAQAMWESAGLTTKSEWVCSNGRWDPTCDQYDNSGGAPGKFFYGRGYIQIAHAYKYRAASKALTGDERTLLDNPDLVATDERYAWGVAFWFWKTEVATKPGYDTEFGVSTKAINGALECEPGGDTANARKRWDLYQKVTTALDLQPIAEQGCYSVA